MTAEGLVGTIYAMITLNASSERITRIARRALDEAVMEERERCAKIAESYATSQFLKDTSRTAAHIDIDSAAEVGTNYAARVIADAIRNQ